MPKNVRKPIKLHAIRKPYQLTLLFAKKPSILSPYNSDVASQVGASRSKPIVIDFDYSTETFSEVMDKGIT